MSDYNLRKNDTARVVNSSFYQKNNLKIGQHNRKNYSQKKKKKRRITKYIIIQAISPWIFYCLY